MQRADGETIAHARNQQPHRQRGERVEPCEPGQITDNSGATTGEDAASERACRALAISSDEFSPGGRQHIAKQPLLTASATSAIHSAALCTGGIVCGCARWPAADHSMPPTSSSIAPMIREAPFS